MNHLLRRLLMTQCLFDIFNILQSRLQHELKKVPKLQKFWNLIKKNYDKMELKDAEQYESSLRFRF